MESRTITLTGNCSSLSANFYPEIQFDERYNYSCCLLDFFTYNSIANVNEKNNKLGYAAAEKGVNGTITIPIGSYEVVEISEYINKKFKDLQLNFILAGNKNTMKSSIYTDLLIDFSLKNSIGPLLGFNNSILSNDKFERKTYESDDLIQIQRVNSIRIDCDLITGSFHNGKSSHTLYEFCPSVSSGYKIILQPKNLIYLPISRRRINTLHISIVDESGELIDFNKEKITCRIHIKRETN